MSKWGRQSCLQPAFSRPFRHTYDADQPARRPAAARIGCPTTMLARASAVAVALLLCSACHRDKSSAHGKRVIVLGVDGMDPRFVEEHWDELPNFKRLRQSGGLERLATTTPPQSPVAWSSFITGMDPAQDGIFDFVHRNPATLQPLSSMAGIIEPAHHLGVGPYELPLSQAHVRSFRRGKAFWEILTEHDIPVTVMRMPANYPPVNGGHALAGM